MVSQSTSFSPQRSFFSGSEVDTLTSSFETLDIRSTATTFAGACERIGNGVLSRPRFNQFERMEHKISEEKVRNITIDPVSQSATVFETEGEDIFEGSNVFGVVGRTPSTEELLQVNT